MLAIRGKLLVYALEAAAAGALLLAMPRFPWWIVLTLVATTVILVAVAVLNGRSIADDVEGSAREISHVRGLLREKVHQLEELAHGLERKVEQRTEELRKANERLSLIHQVTNAVNSSLEFQKIFDAVVEGTRRLVDFDQASIARIVDAETATVFAISGAPAELRQGKKIPLPTSRFSDVLERRQPAVFDVPLTRTEADTFSMSAIRREIVLPLVVGDQVIGTFNLGSRRKDAFSPGEIEVLSQIAAELGVALLQAEAFEREQQAGQKLKELSDLKSEFVSKVSHELRTPLTSIIGAADNLLDGIAGPIDERPRNYLARIKENGDRLLRLINELLDLARIEAGREEIQVTRFRLDTLIQETFDTLKPLAEERGVALAAPAPPAIVIRADRDKISRVLINLVHNGIKFTPAGGRVEIRASGDTRSVKLAVEDSGVGIPTSEIERVFDKFHQLKLGRDTAVGGTGLGLPISRQLVEMHGGRLTAESAQGRGSTFTVELPLSAEPPQRANPTSRERWHAS